MELCDVILGTNRVRCVLNMEILDLLNEESVSGARSSRGNLQIRREVLLSMFEKVSRSLKYDSNIFFRPQTYYCNIIYIYGHHGRSLYHARAARAGGIMTLESTDFIIVSNLNVEPPFCGHPCILLLST